MDTDSTTLLYIDDILNVFLENDILTIKLLGECFTDEIINQMFDVIELFYNICKKTNKKFHTIYDFIDCKIKNLPNYFYYISYITNFLKKHTEFYKIHLINTLIITKTELGKKLCNSVLINYNPTRPIKFITPNDPIDFDFDF